MSKSLPPSESLECDILKCTLCSKPLEDAVLLNCLHNACRTCAGSDVTASITCPVCLVTTNAPTGKTNLLVSSFARRSLVLNAVFSCNQCSDENRQDASAVVWCYTCQMSLCVDCQKYQSKLHSTHKVVHLNEQTNLSELYRPPLRSCTKHQEELRFACFTCKDGCCYKCVHVCYTSSHDVLPLDGPDALKKVNDSVTQATTVLSDLNSALPILQAHLSLPEKVCNAREESLATLKSTKKATMVAISNAYDNAAESLLECWDTLVLKSLGLRESAERLMTRVDGTNRYCQLALNSDDTAGLLPQFDALVSSLRALLDETRPFKEPMDPSKLVRVSVCLPCDLDLIVRGWFGVVKLVSDDFGCSVNDFPAEDSSDYYTRKVSTLKELEQLLQSRKEQQELLQCERKEVEKLQSELILKDQQLVAARKEVEQLLQDLKEQKDLLQLERQSTIKMKQLQLELSIKDQQLISTQTELAQVLHKQVDEQEHIELVYQSLEQLQSEVTLKDQELASTQKEIEQLLQNQDEQQEHLRLAYRTVEQLQSEVALKDQQHAPSSQLSFGSQPRGTFKGPGRCWAVAVTPQGRLLVAAMTDGLKEYDATSFREISTWKPEGDLLGEEKSVSVRAVDSLADGRALVGLLSKVVVLLRRDVGGTGRGNQAWRVERRIAELQAPPRRLSAWGDRLLAVLEDRYDESKMSWLAGPGLVLLSLNGGAPLHRQQLEYNASSVALTDRTVVVASVDELDDADAVGTTGGNKKNYVVDSYSHVGVRLWRHVVSGGLEVMSVCLDTVGRVLYAAKRGSVIALRVDDGQELSTAIALSTNEVQRVYAMGLDRVTRRLLVLICFEGDKPNHIAVFPVV